MSSLNRLTHRGAVASDGKTGDGCGLLLRRPEEFLRAARARAAIELAEAFASGLVFLSPEESQRAERHGALCWCSSSARGCGSRAGAPVPHQSRRLRRGGAEDPAAHRADLRQRRCAGLTEAALQPQALPRAAPRREGARGRRPLLLCAEPVGEQLRLQGDGHAAVSRGVLSRILTDARLASSLAIFHQRFSTNTLPQWRLAHPYRYLAHNGEINTIQGNRNWARGARAAVPLAAAAGSARHPAARVARAARTRRASTTCSRCS